MTQESGAFVIPTLRTAAPTYTPVDGHAPIKAHPANQLPPPARDLLVLASQVRDPLERRAAIDLAIGKARARFPEFFQPDSKE